MTKANVQTGVNAAVTIAARTQSLVSPAAGRRKRRARRGGWCRKNSTRRSRSAQAAWVPLKAAFGGVRTPNDVSAALAGIAEAAAKTAPRKVRANARRLAGTRASP